MKAQANAQSSESSAAQARAAQPQASAGAIGQRMAKGRVHAVTQRSPLVQRQAEAFDNIRNSPGVAAQRMQIDATFGGTALLQPKLPAGATNHPAQLVERTTSIYNRVPQSEVFKKGMEIVDSTSTETYVHISRNALPNEDSINIQQHADFFNGLRDPAKRSRVDLEQPGNQVDLRHYTRANNAHITLEGRYAKVMSDLAHGFADLDGTKSGDPVAAGYNNLNFGSSVDHDGAHASDYDIYTYIHKWAEDAEDYARQRTEDWEGQNAELVETIDRVHDSTADFTTRLITDSPLNELPSEDFVHYAGEEWSPILPEGF